MTDEPKLKNISLDGCIWHYMDAKTVAAYGPWMRHVDARALVAAENRACAELIAPVGERPCDCDGCFCGNPGDNAAVTAWDEANLNAAAIRALTDEDADKALADLLKTEREKVASDLLRFFCDKRTAQHILALIEEKEPGHE